MDHRRSRRGLAGNGMRTVTTARVPDGGNPADASAIVHATR